MSNLFSSSDPIIGQFIRHYRQSLSSSPDGVLLSTFDDAYKAMTPLIHSQVNSPSPDPDGLSYAKNRLPDCVSQIDKIIFVSNLNFDSNLFDIKSSLRVSSPARRRLMYFDEKSTLLVLLNSFSDLDDIITCLLAFRLESLKNRLTVNEFNPRLILSSVNESDFSSQANQWWSDNISKSLYLSLTKEPVYFVSSNVHSLVNIMGGFLSQKQTYIFDFVANNYPDIYQKWFDSKVEHDIYQTNDFLYYLSEKFLSERPEFIREKQAYETKLGIINLPASDSIPINLQIIPLKIFAKSQNLDPNLQLNRQNFSDRPGAIINIQYPLGIAAKYILDNFFNYFSSPRGVYIIGKAAILNGSVGDIQIPNIVLDEITNNIYKFNNIFNTFFPFKNNISQILQNQKAVCVYGTLLETESQINSYKKSQSNIIEMESGHYLASIFQKYLIDGPIVNSSYYTAENLPLDLGIINYASDNPLTENLSHESLDFRGIETTYLSSLTVLQRIINLESAF